MSQAGLRAGPGLGGQGRVQRSHQLIRRGERPCPAPLLLGPNVPSVESTIAGASVESPVS